MGEIRDGPEPYGIDLLGGNHSCIEAPYMVYNRETGYCNLFLSLGGQDVDTVEHVYVPLEFREDNRRVYIQRVHKVLAGQGVLIHNATSTATFADLKRVETTDESYAANMLVGVTVPTAITATAGDKTNLILSQGAFHPTSGGTIAANRAYLQIPTAQWTGLGVKQLTFSFSDTETAIGDIPVSINQREGTTEVYDIAGRRAPADGKLRKGLYVRNGQKTFIR